MGERLSPGLTADWLNAWLAAVGVTALVPGTRLGWTNEPIPRARFWLPGDTDLADLIANRLPTVDELEQLVIAGLPQNVPPEAFQAAAEHARQRHDLSLGVLTTDVGGPGKRDDGLPKGPFNPGAPGRRPLFARLRACRQEIDRIGEPADIIARTLAGRGIRRKLNGLGFDYRRIAASVPGEADKFVDPVIECLCFFGLLIHPLHGDGRRPRQRGWSAVAGRDQFRWPVWTDALDQWAIDGLLDVVYSDLAARSQQVTRLNEGWRRLSVIAIYGALPFRPIGNDPTRGFASVRLA